MNNSKNSEDLEDQLNECMNEVAGSPGSHSNSSSSRQQRIVELIQENSDGDRPADWVISAEFYNEDVAQNSDSLSADETDEELGFARSLLVRVPPEIEDPYIESENDEDNDEDIYGDYADLIHVDGDDEDDDNDDDDMEHIFVPEEYGESGQSDTDSDITANYDTTLPLAHNYLGNDLEEKRGREVYIEGETVNLTLINLRHVVLFPGQTLPITASNLNWRIQRELKYCIKVGTGFGLISDPQTNSIGTTAEIRNHSSLDTNDAEELRIIVMGCQRFQLLAAPFETATLGLVKILPEVSLGHPYPRISTMQKFYTHVNIPDKFIISKHPKWVLKRYDAKIVMTRILDQMKDWSSADLTKNPDEFSYWVAANLPISNGERIKALSFSCTEARLIWLLEILEKSEYFGCSGCRNKICHKNHVFPMSQSGPQCSFVNSGGYIHDTLTVRKARGLIPEFTWSKEFSWFPGYVWRVVHCDNCNRHIGWCYKRTDPETTPKRFFGLSRANVRLISSEPSGRSLETAIRSVDWSFRVEHRVERYDEEVGDGDIEPRDDDVNFDDVW